MSTVVVGTVRSNSSNPPAIQNTSGTEIGTFCRAWVNFNGTLVTNPASMTGVRASFNVSSVLDNGTGNYTVNFTTAMPDSSFVALANTGDANAGNALNAPYTISRTTSSVQFYFGASSTATAYDPTAAQIAIFR